MADLILLRHGQSQWNLENRFTGWVDVPLSERGIAEARAAGAKLRGRKSLQCPLKLPSGCPSRTYDDRVICFCRVLVPSLFG